MRPAAEWPEETRKPFQSELKKILDAPWQAAAEEGKDPLLAPPIYGCWQAARHTVDLTPAAACVMTWLDELNLDPRHRAVAALGTAVVQTQQEQLMASAWEQLGEIERINQMRRQAQLGRAVNAVYHARHFSRFSEETLLKVVAPAQSRVVVEPTGANNDADAAVAKDFAIGHPGQSRLRAVAPVDKPARRDQRALSDGRRAAHRHRGQVEHDSSDCPASEERSRSGDDQPGFRTSERDIGRADQANRSFRECYQRARHHTACWATSRLCPRAQPKRSLLDFTSGAAGRQPRRAGVSEGGEGASGLPAAGVDVFDFFDELPAPLR